MCLITEYFVTRPFNQKRFDLLLESHLSKNYGTPIHIEFIEVSIAGMLHCIENGLCPLDVFEMKKHLYHMDILYKDYRSFSSQKVEGDPIYAVKKFNELCTELYGQV